MKYERVGPYAFNGRTAVRTTYHAFFSSLASKSRRCSANLTVSKHQLMQSKSSGLVVGAPACAKAKPVV